MINNPAKETYMKFDLAADLMVKSGNKANKKSNGKGLLKRFSMNKPKEDKVKDNEPVDTAMKYFMAIRNERNILKQKQDS